MQKVQIYHNPRCSKSREALALLKEKSGEIEIIDYLNHPPSAAELGDLCEKLNIRPEQLIRKKEELFISTFKDKKYSDKMWLKHLSENPRLIERPIVIQGNNAVIGRPPQLILALFEKES